MWQLGCQMFVDILCVWGVIAYQFISCCVMCVAYVDIPRVVTVAEDVELHGGVGSAPQRRRSIYCVILIRIQNSPRGGSGMSGSE